MKNGGKNGKSTWQIALDVPAHLLQRYGEMTRKMLHVRGLDTEDDAERFLSPRYEDLLDPFLFPDMEKAVVRIFEAIEGREKIVIYSDYDCDGIPAATIMSDLFKKIGYGNVIFYIPDRHDEGYGLHMDAVKSFIDDGAKLIVTFDLGTTTPAETAHAMANGLDVIITDHHLSHGELPRAYALINPHVNSPVSNSGEKGGYPEQVLSGAGVAFKLAQAFVKKYGEYFGINEGWEKWLLDMAALGTLSDMVPIRGENRVISYYGMKVLRKNKRPGLRALFSVMNMDAEHVTEDDLTFMVTPRINAASRMDKPIRAFELLSADNDVAAMRGAEHLSKINEERKLMVARIIKEAKNTLSKRGTDETGAESPIVVIGSTGWRAGILGLVAGKLMDELQKPVFVWGMEEEDEHIKGSARSDGSVNIVDLMTANAEYFVQYGGHTVAGGFVVSREKVHFLEEVLSKSYGEILAKHEADLLDSALTKQNENPADQPSVAATNTANDKVALASISLDKVKISFIEEINRFAPFGPDNPKPVFIFQNVRLDAVRQFGKTKEHLEIVVSDDTGVSAKAIAFFKNAADFGSVDDINGADEKKSLIAGQAITLIGMLEISYFRGREARIRIVDILVHKK